MLFIAISSIFIILIVFLTAYVIIKKPTWGLSLLAIILLVIIFALYWNLSEHKREQSLQDKIAVNQVLLVDQRLRKAYGNHYQYQANVLNQSQSKLDFVILSLQLDCSQQITNCQISTQQKVKLWLLPQQQKLLTVYFMVPQLATTVADRIWQVKVIRTRSF